MMLPIDPLWIYIAVPTILVSALVFVKLMQRKTGKWVSQRKPEEKPMGRTVTLRKEPTRGGNIRQAGPDETQLESSGKPKPKNCPHHLGYLYLKKAPDQSPIPTECYGCQMLLKCLYSPNVIEQVYGQ